jgi:hypothetical protein
MPQLTISVGEIIDKSWHYYKKHFGELMSVSGWIMLAAVVNVVALALYPSASIILSEREYTAFETAGVILVIISNFIVTPIICIWITATLVRLIDAVISGRSTTLKNVMKEGKRYFWSYVVASILFGLAICAAMLFLVPGLLFTVAGAIWPKLIAVSMIGSMLMIIGLVASTVCVIIYCVRLFFYTYTLIVDNHKGVASLKESSKLVKGNFWEVLVRLVIPKILFFVICAAILFVFVTIADVITAGVAGLNVDLQVRLNTIVTSVLVLVQAALINPILLIADYLIYKNLTK